VAEEKQAEKTEESVLFIRQGDQLDGYAEVTKGLSYVNNLFHACPGSDEF